MRITFLICLLVVMPSISAQELTDKENVASAISEPADPSRPVLSLQQKKDLAREIINRPFDFSGIPDHITAKFKEDYLRKISADLYSVLLDHFPDSEHYEQAMRNVALYHFENQDYAKAKSYMEKYLVLHGSNRKTIHMHFNLGVVYKELEMYKQAIKSFFQVIDTLGEHELSYEAYLNIAECYERQDNIKKLIMTYENVAGYFNDTRIIASSLMKVSKIFIAQNNYFSAIWNLRRITERYAHSEYYYEALFILAGCYAKTGEIVRQREILQEVASDHSLDNHFSYMAVYALADSYYDAKEYKEASIAYFTALKSDPRYEGAQEARFRLATSYLNLGILDMAETTFEQLAIEKLSPHRKREILFALGKIYFMNNHFEKSIESLQKISNDKEHELSIRYYMAMSYYKLEEYRKAFEHFLHLEHQESDVVMKVHAIIMLGTILLTLDKFDSATHYFDSAIENIDSLTRVDSTEVSQDNKSSILTNDQVEQLNKLKIEALFAFGRGYFKEKQFEKAAQIYQELMPLDILAADRAWVLYQIGKCYENAQDYEKARQMYSELREKYPNYNVAEQAAWDLKNIEWNNRYSKIKNM